MEARSAEMVSTWEGVTRSLASHHEGLLLPDLGRTVISSRRLLESALVNASLPQALVTHGTGSQTGENCSDLERCQWMAITTMARDMVS